jgi:hypothetical protein
MKIPAGGEVLLYGGVVCKAALVCRLGGLGLLGKYPAVAVCVAFSVLRGLLLLYLSTTQTRIFRLSGYDFCWVATQPVMWFLYFLVLLELYSRSVEEFPGIGRLGRLMMYSALAAVTLACSTLILWDQRAGIDPYPFIGYLVLQERSVFVALAAVALLMLLFLGHYRLPIRRNVWVLWLCFGGYYLASAVILTLRWHFGAEFAAVRNLSNAAFYFLALLSATVFLSRAGEREVRRLTPLWANRDRELALSVQLQGFNDALVKVLRP